MALLPLTTYEIFASHGYQTMAGHDLEEGMGTSRGELLLRYEDKCVL